MIIARNISNLLCGNVAQERFAVWQFRCIVQPTAHLCACFFAEQACCFADFVEVFNERDYRSSVAAFNVVELICAVRNRFHYVVFIFIGQFARVFSKQCFCGFGNYFSRSISEPLALPSLLPPSGAHCGIFFVEFSNFAPFACFSCLCGFVFQYHYCKFGIGIVPFLL